MRVLVIPVLWATALALLTTVLVVAAGRTSILSACDSLPLILDGGAGDELRCAAAQGDVVTVRRVLLKHPDAVNSSGDDGWTALHEAARAGCTDVMKALLVCGADVSAKNDDGHTPLHIAARSGEPAAAMLLILNNANANAEDEVGRTPLDLAVHWGSRSAANVLRRHGGLPGGEMSDAPSSPG